MSAAIVVVMMMIGDGSIVVVWLRTESISCIWGSTPCSAALVSTDRASVESTFIVLHVQIVIRKAILSHHLITVALIHTNRCEFVLFNAMRMWLMMLGGGG